MTGYIREHNGVFINLKCRLLESLVSSCQRRTRRQNTLRLENSCKVRCDLWKVKWFRCRVSAAFWKLNRGFYSRRRGSNSHLSWGINVRTSWQAYKIFIKMRVQVTRRIILGWIVSPRAEGQNWFLSKWNTDIPAHRKLALQYCSKCVQINKGRFSVGLLP